jgi:hypothetical protein
VTLFHAQLRLMTHQAIDDRTIEPWGCYLSLIESYVNDEELQDLCLLWESAYREQHPYRVPRHYTPDVATRIEEIRAESTRQFFELFHLLILRSGVTTNRIACRAPSDGPEKLNPSQMYSLLKRGVLPRKGAQVLSFGRACGLDEQQARQLMQVWISLRDDRPTGIATITTYRPWTNEDTGEFDNSQDNWVSDGMRAVIENWLDRNELAQRRRLRLAPAEPTAPTAAREATAMADHLSRCYDGDIA